MKQYVSTSRRVFVFFNTIFLFLLIASMVIPVVNTIAVSFSTDLNSMTNSMILYPKPFTLQGYEQLISIVNIGKQLLNTLYVAFAGTALHILICSLTAYALVRYKFPGKSLLVSLLLISMMVPFENVMIPTYLLYKKLGLVNTYMALILLGSVSGFTVLLLERFFHTIPKSLPESGTIDGANELQMMIKIFYPLAKPGLATLSLFTFLNKWNMFTEALILVTDPQKQMLQVGIRKLVVESEGLQDLGIVAPNAKMAAITISIIPLIILYLFAQKYFEKGLTLGATKG